MSWKVTSKRAVQKTRSTSLRPVASVEIDKGELKAFLASSLPSHMDPKRLRFSGVAVGHRFKRG